MYVGTKYIGLSPHKLRSLLPKNLSTVSVVLARSGPLGVLEDLDRLLDGAVIL